jgi:hypothetical protein
MENNYVVYIHRKLSDGTPFYVGAGSSKRPFLVRQRSKEWLEIVESVGHSIEIYKDGLSQEECFKLEVELISMFGRIDIGTGCLINKTSGGRRVVGLSRDILDVRNKKMSISAKGKVKSKEWRDKIAKSLTGKKASEETRAKMRSSNKSKIITAVPIICYDCLSREVVSTFNSIREAADQLDCTYTSISNNIANRSNSFTSKKLNKKITCRKNFNPSEST